MTTSSESLSTLSTAKNSMVTINDLSTRASAMADTIKLFNVIKEDAQVAELENLLIKAGVEVKEIQALRKPWTDELDSMRSICMAPEKLLQASILGGKESILNFAKEKQRQKEEANRIAQAKFAEYQAKTIALKDFKEYLPTVPVTALNILASNTCAFYKNTLRNSDGDLKQIERVLPAGSLYEQAFDKFFGKFVTKPVDSVLLKECGEDFTKKGFVNKFQTSLFASLNVVVGEPHEREALCVSPMGEEKIEQIVNHIETYLSQVLEENIRADFNQALPEPVSEVREAVMIQDTNVVTPEILKEVSDGFDGLADGYSDRTPGVKEELIAVVENGRGIAEALVYYLSKCPSADLQKVISNLDFVLKYVAKEKPELPGLSYQTEQKVSLRKTRKAA